MVIYNKAEMDVLRDKNKVKQTCRENKQFINRERAG